MYKMITSLDNVKHNTIHLYNRARENHLAVMLVSGYVITLLIVIVVASLHVYPVESFSKDTPFIRFVMNSLMFVMLLSGAVVVSLITPGILALLYLLYRGFIVCTTTKIDEYRLTE